jgi:hypothetical protein
MGPVEPPIINEVSESFNLSFFLTDLQYVSVVDNYTQIEIFEPPPRRHGKRG